MFGEILACRLRSVVREATVNIRPCATSSLPEETQRRTWASHSGAHDNSRLLGYYATPSGEFNDSGRILLLASSGYKSSK